MSCPPERQSMTTLSKAQRVEEVCTNGSTPFVHPSRFTAFNNVAGHISGVLIV
jgi:hypothetical protein